MRISGDFVVGVVLGLVVMQVGHYLYLRNADYLAAAMLTAFFGAVVSALVYEVRG